jgi:hypothetical protein
MRRWFAVMVAVLTGACVTTQPSAPKPPEWLALKERIEPDDTPDCRLSRYGVGGVSGVKNQALRRQSAMSAARGDMSGRLKACWSKRLEGKFPHQSEISDEVPRVSYEMALQEIIGRELDSAVVVERWAPDVETEWVYLRTK